MDQTTRQQIDRLSALLLDLQPAQIDNIIQEAQQEALNEAKQIIKAALVQAILQRAVNHPGMSAPDCAARTPVDEAPAPEPRTGSQAGAGHDVESGGPDGREAIRQEIEAIRKQLRTNEARLNTPGVSQAGSGNNGGKKAVAVPPLREESAQDHPEPSREETAVVQAGTSGVGYYVYCVVSDDAGPPLHDLPEAGVDAAYPVEVLSCCGLRSVVSRVDLRVFDQEQLEIRLQDMDWVQEKAYVHQHVLETVMAQCSLVPMRFCSIYRSEERLREMLTDYRADFSAALTRLAGRQEWAVKVFFEPKQLRTFTETGSEPVQAFKARMGKKSDGAAYFMEKQLENLIKEEAESVGDRATEAIHERLAARALEYHVGALQDKRITGRKETMTLNGAYLVDITRLDRFEAELGILRSEYSEAGVILDLSGPWPPYNFVMIGDLEENTDAPNDR